MPEICDGESLRQWYRLEIRLNTPLWSTILREQFNSSAIVVATGVSLKTLSHKTVSSWLYLLISTSFVKSHLRWLCHINLGIHMGRTWDSHFNLVPNQMKFFILCFFMCFLLFCAHLYCVYCSCSNSYYKVFPFPLSNFHTNNTFVKSNVLVITKVNPRYWN